MIAFILSLMLYFNIRALYITIIQMFALERIKKYVLFNIETVFDYAKEYHINELIQKYEWYKLSDEEVEKNKEKISLIMNKEQEEFIKEYEDFMDFEKIYKRNLKDYDLMDLFSKVFSFEISPEKLLFTKDETIKPELRFILNKEYLKHEDNPNNR